MFKQIMFGCLLLSTALANPSFTQVVKIPDANFKQALIDSGFDKNGDGQIQVEEAKKVTVLYVGNAGIVSLEGIKAFSNVEDLGFYENKIKGEVDLSGMTKLKFIYGFDNQIERLNVKGCVNLVNISCHSNKLRSLDLSDLKKLAILSVGMNELVRLDISNNPALEQVEAFRNSIREFKFKSCPILADLWISNNQITHHLDLTLMPKLKWFRGEKNPIPSVDIRGLADLETFRCYDSNLKTLNLAGTAKLNDLSWY